MARYSMGGTCAAFFRSGTGVVESSSAGTFDSSVSGLANSIFIPGGGFIDTLPFIDASSTTGPFHFHLEQYVSWSDDNNGGDVFEFYNSTGVLVALITSTGTFGVAPWQFQYWNGSIFVNYGASWTPQYNVRNAFDIVLNCGASGTFDLYLGDAKVIADPGAGMNAAFNNIAKVRILSKTSSGCYVSQVISADYDLRNDKYVPLLASGNGSYTDGTGTYTDINEFTLDDATAIVLPVHGNKHSFTFPAYTLPDGYALSAACVVARGRVSGGTITDGEMIVKSGGTTTASTGRGYNAGYEPRGAYFTTDPNTSAPWTQAGFNAAEFGLEAP